MQLLERLSSTVNWLNFLLDSVYIDDSGPQLLREDLLLSEAKAQSRYTRREI